MHRSLARRRNRRALLAALPLCLLALFANPLAPTPEAQSVSTCGYIRNRVLVTFSVPVGAHCASDDHPRCYPGFPIVSVDVLAADTFVCVHWP